MRRRKPRRSTSPSFHPLLGLLALSALAGGCSTPPAAAPGPLRVPLVRLETRHFAGTPLTGPVAPSPSGGAEPAAGGPESALEARVSFLALDRLPGTVLEGAIAHTKFVAAVQGRVPVLPAPLLMRGARAGTVEDAGRFAASLEGEPGLRTARIGQGRGALPVGVTAAFEIVLPEGSGSSDASEGISIQVARPGPQGLSIAVGERGLASLEALDDEMAPEEKAERKRIYRDELLTLDLCSGATACRVAVIVDSPFPRTEEAAAFAAVIEVGPAPSEAAAAAEHAQALDTCRKQIAEAAALAAAGGAGRDAVRLAGQSSVIASLSIGYLQRTSLIHLANETRAPFAGDLLLVADDGLVTAIAQKVLAAMRSPEAPPAMDRLGWTVERSSVEAVLAALSARRIPHEVQSVLVRHAGEAGRQPAALEAALLGAAGMEEFQGGLAAENMNFLEDGSPAARIRAIEWLAARGKAPEGFDPLADAKTRRAALERAAAAAEAQEESR